jgi:hypothetical protein
VPRPPCRHRRNVRRRCRCRVSGVHPETLSTVCNAAVLSRISSVRTRTAYRAMRRYRAESFTESRHPITRADRPPPARCPVRRLPPAHP